MYFSSVKMMIMRRRRRRRRRRRTVMAMTVIEDAGQVVEVVHVAILLPPDHSRPET